MIASVSFQILCALRSAETGRPADNVPRHAQVRRHEPPVTLDDASPTSAHDGPTEAFAHDAQPGLGAQP